MPSRREGGLAWLPNAQRALAWLDEVDGLYGCIEVPPGAKPKGKPNKEIELITATFRSLPAFGTDRLRLQEGARWQAVVSTSPCVSPQDAEVGSGAR